MSPTSYRTAPPRVTEEIDRSTQIARAPSPQITKSRDDKSSPKTCHTESYGFPEPCPNSGAALTKAKREGNGQLRSIPNAARRGAETQSPAGVPEMRIARHQLRGETPQRQQLLAMLEMRRCVEPVATDRSRRAVSMTTHPVEFLTDVAAQLQELIEAIDRRLPQVQRAGEATIANAAVRLRVEAVKRLGEIEREIASRES